MKVLSAVFVFVVVLYSASAAAEARPAEAELSALLNSFLEGASVNEAAIHERFWADDLVYTSSSGERFGKAEIMQGLSESDETTDEDTPAYSARDVEIRVFENTAVITFRLVAEFADETTQNYYNTGVFRERDGQWQAIAWQATQAADTESAR